VVGLLDTAGNFADLNSALDVYEAEMFARTSLVAQESAETAAMLQSPPPAQDMARFIQYGPGVGITSSQLSSPQNGDTHPGCLCPSCSHQRALATSVWMPVSERIAEDTVSWRTAASWRL
jgi:hypothetical protein